MTLAERLTNSWNAAKKAGKYRNLNELAKAGRCGKDRLSEILNARKTSNVTLDLITGLAAALDVEPAWLAFGAGDLSPRPTNALAVIGEVAAGVWFEVDSDAAAREAHPELQPDPRFLGSAQYLLRASGTSMNNLFEAGDLIHCVDIAATGLAPRDNDIVIVQRRRAAGEHEVSAKRFAVGEDGRPLFRADSRDERWRNYTLSTDVAEGEEIAVTALVLRAIREFR